MKWESRVESGVASSKLGSVTVDWFLGCASARFSRIVVTFYDPWSRMTSFGKAGELRHSDDIWMTFYSLMKSFPFLLPKRSPASSPLQSRPRESKQISRSYRSYRAKAANPAILKLITEKEEFPIRERRLCLPPIRP